MSSHRVMDKTVIIDTALEEEPAEGEVRLSAEARRRVLDDDSLAAATSRRVARRRRGWTVVVGPEIRYKFILKYF